MENAHEAIITQEQYDAVQAIRRQRQERFGVSSFKSHSLLTGLIFCGRCGARYHYRPKSSAKKVYYYYICYSRAKVIKSMVRDPNCRNKIWRCDVLDDIIVGKVRELLQSPQMLDKLIASHDRRREPTQADPSAAMEKRLQELDKKISKLMDLYQNDNIPADILSERINALYLEKTELQGSMASRASAAPVSVDIVRELITRSAKIWDLADMAQRRRILQALITRIVLNGDDVQIEWAFQSH